ncbi:MAG: hypothetical protein LZ173_10825 [Thaumarchaeota archaeon]|nr:hypothetical protein [Candidatus Geocrenenecus arthurdayi]
MIQASLTLLLVMLFSMYSLSGSNFGLAGKSFALGNQARVEFEVYLKTDNGTVVPAKDAVVVVGLESNKTDSRGRASIMISPGSYSSYVKLPDIKLAPYTDKLMIRKDGKIIVNFIVEKLYPSRLSIESIENKTMVRITVRINEGYRAYLSDPVLTLIRNDGSATTAVAGPNGHGYFINRITPGESSEIIAMMNDALPYIDPHSSYVPVEIINVVKYD